MKPTLEWLANPEIFAVNREPAHSDHAYTTGEGSLRQYLNGTWKFFYSENPQDRPADFYEPEFTTEEFSDIRVPGHIQLQGYDKPQYVNTQYPWEAHEQLIPPQIPQKRNPVGSYVKYFDAAPSLLGKECYISFQGAETAIYVWLNGEFVGYSEDSFTPSEFRITPYLKEKDNKLAVEVYRYSTASWLEDQDFWRFSGIFRDVYLYAVPEVHVRDMKLTADYDYKTGTGILSAELDVAGGAEYSAVLTLTDADGNVVSECGGISMTAEISGVKAWSAEEPYLYTFRAVISDSEGRIIEIAESKTGFRTFELKDGIMLLNGKRIIFRGVNRHEWNAQHGRCITQEDMLRDIKCMKQNNINAVRTSHYPNNSRWYQLCDEYGIYMIGETNLETHGANKLVPASCPEWKAAVLDRAKSMYERDKNHPAVLIWSCGNESDCGDDIAAMAEYFHKTDSRRLVHYEGVFWNRKYDHITDMESRMYAKPKDIEEYLMQNTGKPYISCEYMHAMGNSLGGMKLYTDLEDKYQAYQGGFIWDYIDQALYNKDGELCYGGDFLDRPSDYEFCTNGIVYADRTSSPKMQEVKALYSALRMSISGGVLTIENRNLFIGTDAYIFRVTLEREGEFIGYEEHEADVPAGGAVDIALGLQIQDAAGEYVLTASAILREDTLWAEKGHEISFAQEIITVGGVQDVPAVPKAELVCGDFCIGVHGEGFSMIFDKREGGVSSLVYDGIEYITRTPKVSFWRAPTDNDKGAGFHRTSAVWLAAGRYSQPASDRVTVDENPDCYVISYTFTAPAVPGLEYRVIYKAFFDGRLGVKLEYPGMAGMPDIPVFAIDFRLGKRYNYFKYYGMGPDENYIDRACGARLGAFSSTAQANLPGYLNPQECGNRTGVRFVSVHDESGRGLEFSCGEAPFEMSVLPYSAYELENAAHIGELPDSSFTWVRLAAKQMGVGGDDSWGSPVQEMFRIPSEEKLTLEFVIEKL